VVTADLGAVRDRRRISQKMAPPKTPRHLLHRHRCSTPAVLVAMPGGRVRIVQIAHWRGVRSLCVLTAVARWPIVASDRNVRFGRSQWSSGTITLRHKGGRSFNMVCVRLAHARRQVWLARPVNRGKRVGKRQLWDARLVLCYDQAIASQKLVFLSDRGVRLMCGGRSARNRAFSLMCC